MGHGSSMRVADMSGSSVSSRPVSRIEWEQFVTDELLNLYECQSRTLDLIEGTDGNLRELMDNVSKLADVLNTRTVTPEARGDSS